MLNKKELKLKVKNLQNEYAEAFERSLKLKDPKKVANCQKTMSNCLNEIFRIEAIIEEENRNRTKEKFTNLISIELPEKKDEAIRQNEILSGFRKKFVEIYNDVSNASKDNATQKQVDYILASMRDRIGIELNQEIVTMVQSLDSYRAKRVLDVLKNVSFYNQRVTITNALKQLEDSKDYPKAFKEAYTNIHNIEYFNIRKNLYRSLEDLQPPTDAQVNKIAEIAIYPEIYEPLKLIGIDVDEFCVRAEEQEYYVFKYQAIKTAIKNKLNKNQAYEFLKYYQHKVAEYEGRKLTNEQIAHLRGLYMKLGEYENTKILYLCTIPKSNYEMIANELESRIRRNYLAKNLSDDLFKDKYKIRSDSYKADMILEHLSKEEEQAKELSQFVTSIYAVVGQERPEEMSDLLPHFIQRSKCDYSTIEEQDILRFRKLVLEQRDVVKSVNREFKWGEFILDQPCHIHRLLGVDSII